MVLVPAWTHRTKRRVDLTFWLASQHRNMAAFDRARAVISWRVVGLNAFNGVVCMLIWTGRDLRTFEVTPDGLISAHRWHSLTADNPWPHRLVLLLFVVFWGEELLPVRMWRCHDTPISWCWQAVANNSWVLSHALPCPHNPRSFFLSLSLCIWGGWGG